jgi:hypothetical protein
MNVNYISKDGSTICFNDSKFFGLLIVQKVYEDGWEDKNEDR